jgi:hypothetical protein
MPPKMRNQGFGRKPFIRLSMESDTLTPSLKALPGEINRILATTFRYYEPQVENFMKMNAPWTDQTGNARNGLSARSGREGKTHYIVAFHQVPYGIYLETRWAGKYAIIVPTIEHFGPKVMSSLTGILNRKFGGFNA